MNVNKKIELLRKRNVELQKELDCNDADKQRVKELLDDLEGIKNEWDSELEKIEEQRIEYFDLISEVKQMKEALLDDIKTKGE